jgi:hypothetical protein
VIRGFAEQEANLFLPFAGRERFDPPPPGIYFSGMVCAPDLSSSAG